MTNTTRDRMLATTVRLLRAQGFHGTGLNQIIKESGTPKGSLYHHFPGGKDQLATEAVKAASQLVLDRVQSAFDSTDSPRAALDKVLTVCAQELVESDYTAGCPIATVALEVSSVAGPVRDACQTAFHELLDLLKRNLVAAGYPRENAQTMAELMITAYEGALLLSQAGRTTGPLQNLRASLPLFLPA